MLKLLLFVDVQKPLGHFPQEKLNLPPERWRRFQGTHLPTPKNNQRGFLSPSSIPIHGTGIFAD